MEILFRNFIEQQISLIDWELTPKVIHDKYLQIRQIRDAETSEEPNTESLVDLMFADYKPSITYMSISEIEDELNGATKSKQLELIHQIIIDVNEIFFLIKNRTYEYLTEKYKVAYAPVDPSFINSMLKDFEEGYENRKIKYYQDEIIQYLRYGFPINVYWRENVSYPFHRRLKYLDIETMTIKTEKSFNDELIEKIGELVNYWEKKKFAQKKLNEIIEQENDIPLPEKLVWLGTPSQFGFIIQELIGKGFLQKPTSSYNRDADFFMSKFDFIKETTKSTIAKELSTSDKGNSLSSAKRTKIKIPYMTSL